MGRRTSYGWVWAVLLICTALVRAGTLAEPVAPPAAPAPATQPKKIVKLLTIGNSFAGNSTRFVGELAKANGNQFILGTANVGGCSLERHWNAVLAAESDPPKPEGNFYPGPAGQPKRTLREMLERDEWDIVTIQQASILSPDFASYQPFANNLVAYVRKHAPQAKIYIHQTWAYREDHPYFKDGKSNPDQMHSAIRAAYHQLASETGLPILPVGDAIQSARKLPEFKFTPLTDAERAALEYPKLPENRSMHTGFRWTTREGKHTLGLDGFHASNFGQYLGACVFYETLFGESVVGNKYRPREIAAEDAAVLQRVAHETVEASAKVNATR